MNIQPPATLIIGEPGTGKTDVIATFLEAGLETFVIITEPDGVVSLLESVQRRKLPIDNLHWSYIAPAAPGWDAMDSAVKTIADKSYEDIAKIKDGVGKTHTRNPAMKLLATLRDFKCERTGYSFGDISTWDDSRAIALDSWSGVSLISWDLTIGYKPAAHQGEWGVAMNFLEKFLLKITADRNYHFAMTAHSERESDDITGATKTMVSTLGKKLAPKIPRFFSEVVSAKKIVTALPGKPPQITYVWSTFDQNMTLKNRILPVSDSLVPSFKPIVDAHRRRQSLAGAQSTSTPKPAAPTVATVPPKVVPQAAPMTRPASTTQTSTSTAKA